jgi:hypothetical protein
VKTEFLKRPESEKRRDSEKFLAQVMRKDFDPAAYWKRIRREIAEEQGSRG